MLILFLLRVRVNKVVVVAVNRSERNERRKEAALRMYTDTVKKLTKCFVIKKRKRQITA